MIPFDYGTIFKLLGPEIVLTLTALVVLLTDLKLVADQPQGIRRFFATFLSAAGILGALLYLFGFHPTGVVESGTLVMDPLTQLVKGGVLLVAFFAILNAGEAQFSRHFGEYFALILLATAGMTLMVSAEEILMIFVALELTSLSLYCLAAFNKREYKSLEAALKYFLFGGVSAAFTLFGFSLIYGLTGATQLSEIALALSGQPMSPLLLVAMLMVATGFGFKIAVVPFHLWAPDTYEGAPSQSAAFIASGSKVASFFLLGKIMILGLAGAEGSAGWKAFATGWMPALAILALLSMVLGNFAAIAQSSVKRLLAYSAIAHGGYTLLGILGNSEAGLIAIIYYIITYALAVIGAFAVIHVVERDQGNDQLSSFAGFARRSPLLASSMLVFILSLAGIPPLPGFLGKFYLFAAALDQGANLGLLWLVVIAIAMSAVSLYYYLQILKQIFVVESTDTTEKPFVGTPIIVPVTLAVLILVVGCLPDLFIAPLADAIQAVVVK